MTIGYERLSPGGHVGARVSANGRPHWKTVGITIDWSKVAAALTTDTTLPDGMVVPAGYQFLRYGQPMAEITAVETQTVTVDGTGGTFTLTGTRPDTGNDGTTGAIAEAATAATVQTALEAIFGAGNVAVTGSAGGPFTVTFPGVLDGWDVAPLTASGALLTGGAATVVIATTQGGASAGKYGPYDPEATDGRQATPANGAFGILDITIIKDFPTARDTSSETDHAGLIVGGRLFKARVIQSGTASASLAAGPTLAALEAALKTVEWVNF